jgi:predicted GH43/DUF377 family glycosyl hydrolase
LTAVFSTLLAGLLLLAAGCGRYADFTLPPAEGGPAVTWSWSAHPSAVLTPADWASHDVLNPSVVARDSALFNFYSGFDGRTWHTGLATSGDGVHWQTHGIVLSPRRETWEGDYIAANGAAIWTGSAFLYWYQGGPKGRTRIGLARSPDGRNWTREPDPVLDFGPRGSWDEISLGDPYVISIGDTFYLYYLGQDRARRQRLGVAHSHDGVRWEKLRSNPVMELGGYDGFDEAGLGEPAVWRSHGAYWMLYTGRDRSERRRMGLARSEDGVRWQRSPLVISGEQPWNTAVVCDATVLPESGRVRVWYGGGNRPSPDENLNGAIGLGDLRATLAK